MWTTSVPQWRESATAAAIPLFSARMTIRIRYGNVCSVYHEQTEPLKSYYAAAGKLFVVEGQEEIADTSRLVLAALEQ